jgi:DNA-binding beta-propeller fold protein YncE
MNRRDFLATTAAVATGPLILGAEDKGGTKNPVLGVDGHKYEVTTHAWGELPADTPWQTTHNVAFDSEGNAYITHQGLGTKAMDVVFVFDPKGKFVRSFGRDYHGGGHGVEIRKEGNEEFCYLSNTWHQFNKLLKTTLKGEIVWVKGRPECKEYDYRIDPKDKTRVVWPAYNPTNVCFTADGGFIVGDGYGSHHMLQYDKDAKLTKVFGGAGKEVGKLQTPHGQWIDDRVKDKPVLVVCDRANHRLSTFDMDGKVIGATAADEVVLFPAHCKTRGDVLLVPDLHARVSLFGKDNKPITHLGDDAEWRKKVLANNNKLRTQPTEWAAGKFIHPHDAAFDKDGNILVVEWVSTGRVSFLKKVG